MPKQLPKLQKMHQAQRRLTALMLLLLAAALASAFFNPKLTLGFLAAAVLFHLAVLRPAQKDYAASVTQANLENTLCRTLGAATALEHAPGCITSGTILRSELMPCKTGKNSPLLCWQITGDYGKMNVSLCDATIAQPFSLVKKGRRRVHFNAGVWTHIELPKDCQKRFFLLNETSVPTPIRMEHFQRLGRYENIPLQDEKLAGNTALYCPKGEPGHCPPASFLHEYRQLADYTPGYTAISVDHSHMDVFIRGRFLSRPVSVSKKPGKELLEFDPFPELSYLLRLASAMITMKAQESSPLGRR